MTAQELAQRMINAAEEADPEAMPLREYFMDDLELFDQAHYIYQQHFEELPPYEERLERIALENAEAEAYVADETWTREHQERIGAEMAAIEEEHTEDEE